MAYLNAEQVEEFERDRYLVATGLFDYDEDLLPVVEVYSALLDELALDFFEKGEIASTHAELAFGERLTPIYEETGRHTAQHLDISLPQKNVDAETPFWAGPAVFWLQPTGRSEFPGFVARSRSNPETELRNDKLLDARHAMWRETRDRLAMAVDPVYNRWTEANPACA